MEIGRTITDVFHNPLPDEVDAVRKERTAGLEELELIAGGLMQLGGEQPDAQIDSEPGALRGGIPLSEEGEGK